MHGYIKSMPKDFEKSVGPMKSSRKEGKYIIETPSGSVVVNSRDELMYLKMAVDAIFEEEHREVLEERRAAGQKTYVEYRGEQVAFEY